MKINDQSFSQTIFNQRLVMPNAQTIAKEEGEAVPLPIPSPSASLLVEHFQNHLPTKTPIVWICSSLSAQYKAEGDMNRQAFAILRPSDSSINECPVAVQIFFSKRLRESQCYVSSSLSKYFHLGQKVTLEKVSISTAEKVEFEIQTESHFHLPPIKLLPMHFNGLIACLNGPLSLSLGGARNRRLKCIKLTSAANEATASRIGLNTQILIKKENDSSISAPNRPQPPCVKSEAHIRVEKDLQDRINKFMTTGTSISRPCQGHVIHGCPGSGKTFLVKSTLEDSKIPYLYVKGSDFFSAVDLDAERRIVQLFRNSDAPILVIDDFDLLVTDKKESLVPVILTSLFEGIINSGGKFLIAITSDFSCISKNPFLQNRVFSSNKEIFLPDAEGRRILMEGMLGGTFKSPLSDHNEFLDNLSLNTQGYSPADLKGMLRLSILRQSGFELTEKDVTWANVNTHPSNLAGIVSKIPNITFEMLFGLDDTIRKIEESIVMPLREQNKLAAFGITPPKGILIHGPSGVGKTAIACATANACNLSCIYVESTSIRSKIVGESEKTIANIFKQARSASPCILLIDQLESILSKRGGSSTSQGSGDRIVTCFLTEMDGIMSKSSGGANVFIIAITSDLGAIDPAVLRAGRLDIHIGLKLPNLNSRISIILETLKKMPNSLTQENIETLAFNMPPPSTSVDVLDICRKAAMNAIRTGSDVISLDHF